MNEAIFLLIHLKSNSRLEELYFVGAEIIPTCLMLYIFRGDGEEGGDGGGLVGSGMSHTEDRSSGYKLLRETLDMMVGQDSRGVYSREKDFGQVHNNILFAVSIQNLISIFSFRAIVHYHVEIGRVKDIEESRIPLIS